MVEAEVREVMRKKHWAEGLLAGEVKSERQCRYQVNTSAAQFRRLSARSQTALTPVWQPPVHRDQMGATSAVWQ